MSGHFGRDFQMQKDLVTLPQGDVAMTDGLANYVQALGLRLSTEKGDLWAHLGYGVRLRRFLKAPNTVMNRIALEQEIQRGLEEDPRTVPGSAQIEVMSWDLNRITVRVRCKAVGQTNPLNLVLAMDSDGVGVETA